ncbi:hypothetical protein [Megalodesulfovibrio paquesii]
MNLLSLCSGPRVILCTAAMLLSLSLCGAADAFTVHRDNQNLFKRGCYIDNSRFSKETGLVCGNCRNNGYQVCCNAFSQTDSYSCAVSEQATGSGSGLTISEAVAKACGCN